MEKRKTSLIEFIATNPRAIASKYIPTVMSYPVICTRHFLQTCCNQCVRKTDTTVRGVRLLHDLTTKACIQSGRLLPKDFL